MTGLVLPFDLKLSNRHITMLKPKRIIIIFILVILGYVGYRWWQSRNQPEYETITIKRGDVTKELILSGEIIADEYVQLSFQTAGEIAWIGAYEGDFVEKGQDLARLDTTKLWRDLEVARSNLRHTEATLYEVYDGVKGHDSDETFEQAADRTYAEALRDNAFYLEQKAVKDLANATLKTPITGIVTYAASLQPKVAVLPTQTQFEVTNPASIYFQVSADQSEVIALYTQQPVTIRLDSFPDQEITGTIKRIAYTPKVGETGTVYEITVDFQNMSNNEFKYRVGMTGDATFVTDKKENILSVPLLYIKSDDQGQYIFVNDPSKKVYVDTGIETDEDVEIINNIKEGDIVFNLKS